MGGPKPRGANVAREVMREARDATRVLTLSRMDATAVGESAASARLAVGVEMLYGALVLVRT